MRVQDIFDNKNITANSRQLAILKQNFPQCFDKSGKFDIETLSQILGVENIKKEGFELKFLGKSYARLTANLNPKTLLMPDIDHNSKNENAQNLLIKGDNLEVLKHLKNAYFESIKMIYIDPPYNTGSDGFVYKDDRKFNVDELSSLAGISQEEAKRVLEFTAKGSNSHSAWLSFIYPRLYIARELLRDDGVIFISIDDNEQAQLKILCDEIFGEENFVGNFKWIKTATPPSLSKTLRRKMEYILCYSKKQILGFNGDEISGGDMPLLNSGNRNVILNFPPNSVIFKIDDGIYIKSNKDRVILLDDLEIQCSKNKNSFRLQGEFKWTQETLNEEILNGTKLIVKSNKFAIRYERNEIRNKLPADILSKDECNVLTNEEATKEINELFHCKVFDTPKPISLLKYLIRISTADNDIILDFFAGSGTTAHAVMAQNLEDGGNRKFILVQLDEKIDERNSKVAYDFCKNELKSKNPTIFDITKERILRAAQSLSLSLSLKTMRGLNLKSFRPFHF